MAFKVKSRGAIGVSFGIPILIQAGEPCQTISMTTLILDHSSAALDDALRQLSSDHEAVMIEQDGRVIAVLVPPLRFCSTLICSRNIAMALDAGGLS